MARLPAEISIHAPVKGATRPRAPAIGDGNFNPRSREGSDDAPRPLQSPAINFNPRSREGSDRLAHAPAGRAADFNPRSREGSDPGRRPASSARLYFNPRSREGSDLSSSLKEPYPDLFQSTLP